MRYKTDQRYELKYLLHRDQVESVAGQLSDYTVPDAYGGDRGHYLVTSLYFDTADYKAYWDKIDGHKFRRKLRVRVYGEQLVTSNTPVYVEIKQRLDRALEKRRLLLPYATAVALDSLDATTEGLSAAERAVQSEVVYLARTLQLRPACVVSYNRTALNGGEYDPGLRITFDGNLKGRVHDLTLQTQGQAENSYFFPPDWCIMEVKINHRVPYWLTEIIGMHGLLLRRVSKYCAALENSKAILSRQHIAR